MSTIKVEKSHALSIDDAKKALEPFGAEIEQKYMMKMTWNGNKADLKGTGASGAIEVSADKVIVTVKLGLAAKAFGIKPDKVQSSIDKRLAAALEA